MYSKTKAAASLPRLAVNALTTVTAGVRPHPRC
jgi:hypothetical protein